MLTKEETKDFYNNFGSKQDTQGFYEDRALQDLIDHAAFDQAHSVFEFGIGTGKFAEELLANHLPADCRYSGVDISQTMLDLSTERLQSWSERVEVQLSDGSMQLPAPDGAFDRFVWSSRVVPSSYAQSRSLPIREEPCPWKKYCA